MKHYTYILIFCLLLIMGCQKDKRHLVVSNIQSAAKLATTETVLEKIVLGTKTRKFMGLVRVSQAHFAAHSKAVVKTGIDLTKLKSEDIIIKGKKIELALPAVEVLNFSYPFQSYKIDSTITEKAFLNNLTIYDHEEFFRRAELDIREHIEYMGIRKETESNTRKLMQSMLLNLGFEEIYISFNEGEFIKPLVLPGPESDTK